jgi:hypothetical protein
MQCRGIWNIVSEADKEQKPCGEASTTSMIAELLQEIMFSFPSRHKILASFANCTWKASAHNDNCIT